MKLMADMHSLEKRAHFVGSSVEYRTLERHGQPNLRPKAAHREDWLVSRKVINQSKIR